MPGTMFDSPLARVLGLRRGDTVAFTGSGGKTTCAEALARSAGRTVLTTTTKMRVPERCLDPRSVDEVAAALGPAPLILGRVADDGRKLVGPPRDVLEAVIAARVADLVVIEADGSRGASVKGYRDQEPVVPRGADHVVVLIGVDALGTGRHSPLVHRAERLWSLLGLDDEDVLDAPALARAIFEQPGYLPAGCTLLLNKVDSPQALDAAHAIHEAIAPRLSGAARVLWRGRMLKGEVQAR